MADNDVRITNREIYDLVQEIKNNLTKHMADSDARLRHLEARAGRPWEVWLAVAGSVVALPVAVWAAMQGGA
jgi:hypothetical protein